MAHDPRPQPLRFEWEQALRNESELPSTTRLVLLVMATYGNLDGTGIRVGVERLAASAAVSEATAKRALSNGRRAGWIRQDRRGHRVGDGSVAPSEHSLTVPAALRDDTTPSASLRITGDPESARSTDHQRSREDFSSDHPDGLFGSSGGSLRITGDPLPVVTRETRGESAPARPRCAAHSHLAADDPGPPCLRCRDARLEAEHDAAAARSASEHRARSRRDHDRAELDACARCNRDGWNHDDHHAPDRRHLTTLGINAYSPTGVIGQPSAATPEKGHKALHQLAKNSDPIIKILTEQ